MLKKNCKARHYHPKIWMQQRGCYMPCSTDDNVLWLEHHISLPTKKIIFDKFADVLLDKPLTLYVRKINPAKLVAYLEAIMQHLPIKRVLLFDGVGKALLDSPLFVPTNDTPPHRIYPVGYIGETAILDINLRSQQLRINKRKGVTYQSLATGASLVGGQSVDIIEVHNKRQLNNICSWLENI